MPSPAAYVPDYHVLSSDDVLPAEGAQSVYDCHDDFIGALSQQHQIGYGPLVVGAHDSTQQVRALLVMNTPDGIRTRGKRVEVVVSEGINKVELHHDYDTVEFFVNVSGSFIMHGAKAWVTASFAGGPLTSEQMNFLSPAVHGPRALESGSAYWIHFGTYAAAATPNAIRRVSVAWYGRPRR